MSVCLSVCLSVCQDCVSTHSLCQPLFENFRVIKYDNTLYTTLQTYANPHAEKWTAYCRIHIQLSTALPVFFCTKNTSIDFLTYPVPSTAIIILLWNEINICKYKLYSYQKQSALLHHNLSNLFLQNMFL